MPNVKEYKLYKGKVVIKFDEEKHKYWLVDQKTTEEKKLCGVTSYIKIIDKPNLIYWSVNTTVDFIRDHLQLLKDGTMSGNEILQKAKKEADRKKLEAADIGTKIHDWCEEYIKFQLKITKTEPDMPKDDRVLMGTTSFMHWVEQHKVKFLWSEKVVYSKKHGYVGKGDIGIKIGKKKYLADIKTGNGLYPEVKLQTAAYLMAEQEESGTNYAGRWALRISKETEDEYQEKMLKKGKSNYPPYQIFEALFLDEDESALEKDFIGFKTVMNLHKWKSYATKEFNKLKKQNL